MFCPRCSYEYRQGFHVCSDCLTDLVDKLPPKIIETAPVVNKPIPKRFWIAFLSGTGLIVIWVLIVTLFNNIYWDFIPIGLGQLVDIIFLACSSGLLLYPAYWGLRNIKPLGRVRVYLGLTIVTLVAAKTTAIFLLYTYYQWPYAILYILGRRFEY